MKTFKKFVKEGAAGVGPHAQTHDLDQHSMGQSMGNPELLRKLNAYVGKVAMGTYMLPEDAIADMREKLGRLGITFAKTPVIEGASGSFSLPIQRFGGVFGKSVTTPFDEFDNDDGTGVEGGLSLNLTFQQNEANCYKLMAKIS